jgi:hypothetical protein
MATRSVIKVEGLTNAQLYKHYDGYPGATLPWLEKFNTQFTQRRGEDPSYKFAQLIRSTVFMKDEFNLDESTDTGWGVVGYSDNLGQEFEYLLKSDGTVTYRQIE